MGPDTSRWRSSEDYEYLDKLTAPRLAWEWLRRNRTYQRDFAESTLSPLAAQRLGAVVAPQWGLRFRGGSNCRRQGRRCFLDARNRSGHRNTHGPSFVALGRKRGSCN